MARTVTPEKKVQKVINETKTGFKNPAADKLMKKVLINNNISTEPVRRQLNDKRIFFQKLFLECNNRVEVLGADCEEYRTIDPEIYEALESGKVIDIGRSTDVVTGRTQDSYSGVNTLNVSYDAKTKLISKVQKDGTKTALVWKELLAVKRHIFGEQAGAIDAGHETGLATQKLETTLNIVAQIKSLTLDTEEKAILAKIEQAIRGTLKLLNQIDKLKAATISTFQKEGVQLSGSNLVNDFVAWSLADSEEVNFGTSSTDSTDFQSDDLSKKTEISYEDGELNKTKGRMSNLLVLGLNQLMFNILNKEGASTKTAKILEPFVEHGNSISYIQAVEQNILHRAIGKKYSGGKKQYKPVLHKDKIFRKAQKLRLNPKINRGTARPLKKKDAFAEVGILMGFINAKLPQQVISNMGKPSLQNQTGRFAQSAKVTSTLPAAGGGMVLNYSYDDRYRGFENNSRYPLEYDPRGIISKSIRELAQTQAQFKFITRRV